MNWILAYYQQIKAGNIIVGHWVMLFYERIVRGLEDGEWFYNDRKAQKAIRFVENFCRHHEGPKAPGLIKLELWQKALTSVVFGIMDKNDRRQFREVVLIIARKNGKTLFAAAISAYMMFMDGEYGARIYFAAPKLEQASLCYDAFCQMIANEPELQAIAEPHRFSVTAPSTNSSAKPLSFNSKTSDGFNIHLAVADEIASWRGDQGLKFYNVLRSSFGARTQPLLFSISTAGYVNGSIYDDLMKRGTSFLMGNSKEKRLAPIFYIIDDPEKWNDINELRKSNPNLGVSVSVDYLMDEIAIAEGSLSKKAEFLTKYCNIKQSASTAWLPYQVIDHACGEALALEDFKGCYAVGGIDLSKTTDLTSACVCIERDDVIHVISHFWMPAERLEEATEQDCVPYNIYVQQGWLSLSGDNHVDYRDCFNWFRDLVRQYKIYPLKIGYDRYCAQYLIDDLKAAGFHMDDVWQGFNQTPVIREFEGLIRDNSIDIGNNQLLKMHLLNSALLADSQTEKVRLVKLGNRMRIDGTAALLDAMTVRQKWFSEIGRQLKNNKGAK